MSNQHQVAEQLRQLSRLYINTQKYRIKYNNMLLSKVDYLLKGHRYKWETYFKEEIVKRMGLEKQLKKEMEKILPDHPWSEWLLSIRGLGTVIAASIIGETDGACYGTIEKDSKEKPELHGYGREFERTSDLWAYAGFAVKDGKAVRRTKNEVSNWNKYLKLACYKFSESQIRQGEKYREVYNKRKSYEQEKHPNLSKGHIHARSKRYMIKKFLSDYKHDCMQK